MLNFAERTGSGVVMIVWSFLAMFFSLYNVNQSLVSVLFIPTFFLVESWDLSIPTFFLVESWDLSIPTFFLVESWDLSILAFPSRSNLENLNNHITLFLTIEGGGNPCVYSQSSL